MSVNAARVCTGNLLAYARLYWFAALCDDIGCIEVLCPSDGFVKFSVYTDAYETVG